LGTAQEIQKSNDDREPNNTAGKPILRSILSKQLTNTLVVVVRYFGGKLLGVPGLIQAYGESANEALKAATIIEEIITEHHLVIGNYEDENEVYKAYKQFGAKIISHTYNGTQFSSIFEVRKSKATEITNYLKEKRLFEIKFISEQ
jgi:putative IMPACT (imprinted ancient) family translation regulator